MPIYEFYRANTPTNFSVKASKFSARFVTNHRLRNITLNSVTNTGNQVNVDVNINLDRKQERQVKKLVNRCFIDDLLSSDEETEADADVAPVATNDEIDGYRVGSTWTDKVNKKIYKCVDATEGAAVWKDLTSIPTVTNPIYSTDTNNRYNQPIYVSKTTWLAVSNFPFEGGTTINILRSVVKLDKSTTVGEIQIINCKNGDVLTTISVSGSSYLNKPSYVNSTNFSNVPTEDTILTLRIRRVSGHKSFRHYSFCLN